MIVRGPFWCSVAVLYVREIWPRMPLPGPSPNPALNPVKTTAPSCPRGARCRAEEGCHMNFDKYTDRARGFVQAAQSLALREGHQQFGTDLLLKVLIDAPEGLAARIIESAGGRPGDAL